MTAKLMLIKGGKDFRSAIDLMKTCEKTKLAASKIRELAMMRLWRVQDELDERMEGLYQSSLL